jgi:tetratricopeptide (TPR) repeat protein
MSRTPRQIPASPQLAGPPQRRQPRPPRLALAALAAAAALAAGCSGTRTFPGDNEPTLAALAGRRVAVQPDGPAERLAASDERTIAAYRQFLEAAPQAPQRAEAMRRLGDLEMDRADRIAADGNGGEPDYGAAIARYEAFLAAHPHDPQRDRVLYQLARAQEQGGRLEAALATLTTLVAQHPATGHADEAHFRRGELLFATRQYAKAEAAYATVLAGDAAQASPYTERARYMQGWSRFKQGKVDEALEAFFAVLDARLGALPEAAHDEADLAALPALKRADRELVEDTFRVVAISLASLQGAETIAPLVSTPGRQAWQFRVFQALAELYTRQERIKDAADTYALFVRRQPLHAQAPQLQARVIELYARNGFESLALDAKRDHVLRHGPGSEFARANPAGYARAAPQIRLHLVELARHHHWRAQQAKRAPAAAGTHGDDAGRADVQAATRWYRTLLTHFAEDADSRGQRFLLAELLTEDGRWAEAAAEYERVAYAGGPADAQAADAGYAALLARARLEAEAGDAAARAAHQREAVDSALRFGAAFAADARSGAVLTRAAEQLFALGDGARAAQVARQALALQPAPEQRRTAWTVIAHQAFEQAQFDAAEQAYAEVLALTAPGDRAARERLAERQAAAIYRQGEAARSTGDARAAVAHFERIAALGAVPAGSAVRASAQYDAAAALIGLKDWSAAARTLEAFRRQHPGHALQAEVAPKLALAYLELGRGSEAAAEFEQVAARAAQAGDAAVARAALWQAAELHHQAAIRAGTPATSPVSAHAATHAATRAPNPTTTRAATSAGPRVPAPPPEIALATRAWERYLALYPQPLEPAVQARWHLATLARQAGQTALATRWLAAVQQADAGAGEARTPRTRALGGQATLLLAEPLLEAYRQVALVEPLARNLKTKKARLEAVLQAYAQAGEVEVAEVLTAATLKSAQVYQDFGRALLQSQRPKKLSKLELEQYNVMLEEQAFPFEEKAIALHERNARRAAQGVWDDAVQASFAELAALKPARYAKAERGDPSLPADASGIEAAIAAVATRGAPAADAQRTLAALYNQLGIAQRRQGRFEQARQAYEAAIAADPAALLPALNLGVLHDLYLGDAAQAQAHYQRALALSPADASTLNKWLAELKARKPEPAGTLAKGAADGPAATSPAATLSAARKEPLP